MIDRVEALAASLAAGDFDALPTHLGVEFYGYAPGDGEPTAAERISGVVGELKKGIPDLAVTLSGIAADGEEVIARIRLTGTHTAHLWGAAPTRNEIEWEAAVRFREVTGGIALRFEGVESAELGGLLRLLGMVNPPDEMHLPSRNPMVQFPDFLMKLVFTGQVADRDCPHLADIVVTDPDVMLCQQCVEKGSLWPALRMCLTCGFVGCCDTSVNRHTHAHYEETGHPLYRSIRLNEQWMWCYDDDAYFEGVRLDAIRAG